MPKTYIAFHAPGSPADWTCTRCGETVPEGMPLVDTGIRTQDVMPEICAPCVVDLATRTKQALIDRTSLTLYEIKRAMQAATV